MYSTLIEVVRCRAAESPHRPAFVYLKDGELDEERLTFGEVDEQARAIAAKLQSRHKPGERALLLYPSGLDFIAAFLGCLYAGVVAVPAYPPQATHGLPALSRLRAITSDCQVSTVLTTERYLRNREALGGGSQDFPLEWCATDHLDPGWAQAWVCPPLTSYSMAFLQYTSGSTAQPKGVMVTHQNLLHNEEMIRVAFQHTSESTVVGWLPLYHDMGLIGNVLQPLYIGAQSVLMSPIAFLQRPARWLEAITRYGACSSGGPNFGFELCARKIAPALRSKLDLSTWKIAFNGAEPIRSKTLIEFAQAFAPYGFRPEAWYPCYGLAEITLFGTGVDPGARPTVFRLDAAALQQRKVVPSQPGIEIVGSGRTWLDRRVAIVDPVTHTRCDEETIGEVWLAGLDVAQGYWNRPAETAETFRATIYPTSEGPFLRTGDLGFMRDGELFVTGRIKDLIILNGRNYYPQDIEQTVEASHPAIRPAGSAAFGVEIAGRERLVVMAELERDFYRSLATQRQPRDRDEILRAIRNATIEGHDVYLHDAALIRPGTLPKTSSGKLRRGICRQMWLSGEFEWVGRLQANAPATVEVD